MTDLLFLGRVLLHKFVYFYVAQWRGIFMRALDLLPLGELRGKSQGPSAPGQALRNAAAGPFVNLYPVFSLKANGK